VAVALADKLDTLVGFWAIDEKPTGSKDPYALRRAALGVIRVVIDNEVAIRLSHILAFAREGHVPNVPYPASDTISIGSMREALEGAYDEVCLPALLYFFHDRLKVYLRDEGARYDLIDAVLAASEALNDDLLLIVRRVEALSELLGTEDGKNLLTGTNRAVSIVAAEEKKGTRIAEAVDPGLFTERAEKALYSAVNQVEKDAAQAIQNQDFAGAMKALATLREPIDSFFEEVLVNDENDSIRANRLALLNRIRQATGQVADFSKIAG